MVMVSLLKDRLDPLPSGLNGVLISKDKGSPPDKTTAKPSLKKSHLTDCFFFPGIALFGCVWKTGGKQKLCG